MAAVQPHLSGAISKTVNMPESATDAPLCLTCGTKMRPAGNC
jgi:ribonucleotide reductase alpha subunit